MKPKTENRRTTNMKANTKKEAKWTGGDWRVGDGEIGAVNDIYAVSAGVVTEVARVRRVPGELEMVVANAQLFAASKDMYAALEDAPEPADWFDSITASHIFFEKWFTDYRKWYLTHRRPALAKAEGRE